MQEMTKQEFEQYFKFASKLTKIKIIIWFILAVIGAYTRIWLLYGFAFIIIFFTIIELQNIRPIMQNYEYKYIFKLQTTNQHLKESRG